MTQLRKPHANSYQVPGTRLLAGEYPFHDTSKGRFIDTVPSMDPRSVDYVLRSDERIGAVKLMGCIDSGIDHFLDLTEEHESHLLPYHEVLVRECATAARPLVYERLTIRDVNVPSHHRMVEILDAIDAAAARGAATYVHCWGGIGRTGTVVGCYLVRHGMTGGDALDVVGNLFSTMSEQKVARHRGHGSPETEAQRAFVRSWSEVGR